MRLQVVIRKIQNENTMFFNLVKVYWLDVHSKACWSSSNFIMSRKLFSSFLTYSWSILSMRRNCVMPFFPSKGTFIFGCNDLFQLSFPNKIAQHNENRSVREKKNREEINCLLTKNFPHLSWLTPCKLWIEDVVKKTG